MRNIPRAIEILLYVIQQSRMDNIKEMYDIFQIFTGRFFIYMKSIILHEFSSFMPESNNLDDWEYKNDEFSMSKQAIADFAAFFVVCALFGIFFIISTKYTKENDNFFNLPDHPPLAELTTDDRDSIYDLPNLNHPWGDSSSGPETFIPPRHHTFQKKLKPYCITADYKSSRHSGISIRTTQSHQSTQTSTRISTHLPLNETWLVRKTRSGQIYGRYPM